MLITGGIGDLLTVESRISTAQKARIEAVYYAAPAAAELRTLMAALPNYPKLTDHIVLPTGGRTHYSRVTVERVCGRLPAGTEDWSVGQIFPRRLPLVGSSFLTYSVGKAPVVPGPYVVIVPHSTWGRWADRGFNERDWQVCLNFLEQKGLFGVVLCRETLPIPTHPRLLDWQGKTTILESVELLKAAEGYVGIDSALSVLATQRFAAGRLAVKGHGAFLKQWLDTYYAPHTNYSFVRSTLEAPSWD